MVIVKLNGGLGNQMFQYAAAYSLATQYSQDVKLDVSTFANDDLRGYDLECFDNKFLIASADDVRVFKHENASYRIAQLLKPVEKRNFYKERFFHFDPSFFKLRPPVYIKGYFQTEKYFKNVTTEIKKQFEFRPEIVENARSFLTSIKGEETVSLHIRRGDYNNPKALQVHGLLPISYYLAAIEHVKKRIERPRFFLFSDDPKAAKDLLPNENITIVSGVSTQNHFEDLYLMSQCRHNIIANSSFSWWAAWLNSNPNKIVIAPRQWFNRGPKDTYDLLPESWIKL